MRSSKVNVQLTNSHSKQVFHIINMLNMFLDTICVNIFGMFHGSLMSIDSESTIFNKQIGENFQMYSLRNAE